MTDSKNFLLFIVCSLAVLVLWEQFFAPEPPAPPASEQAEQSERPPPGDAAPPAAEGPAVPEARPSGEATAVQPQTAPAADTRTADDDSDLRRPIETPRVQGTVSLRGGRIDDLTLKNYRVSPDKDSDNIVLLRRRGTPDAYYAEFGWSPAKGSGVAVPASDTVWSAPDVTLTPDNAIEMRWDNGQGVTFIRTVSIDDNYMFTVTQRVENNSDRTIELAPYALVNRRGTPETRGLFILHEGPLGVLNETLEELDYDDLREDGPVQFESTGGWLGITDKYWLTAILPVQDTAMRAAIRHSERGGVDRYQADYILGNRLVAPGGSTSVTGHLFAGAKEVDIIEHYEDSLGVTKFGLAIDWGYLSFLTRPIFLALDWIFGIVGNFGIAILLLTVGIKLIFFPLANKSYVAMSRMKKLQPKMKALQKQYKDDKVRLQQEMMALYKKEKVNPASGCLPILIQIPVFFALYKVLFVTIEMRHAPFFGWVNDLSAPDPLIITNLFGLIPWTPPDFLAIGIWPLVMGLSMFLQQRLNPTPPDPTQQKIMMMLPVVFTFILATFPVGLVIYWTWNNVLSIAQQWVIMKRQGVT